MNPLKINVVIITFNRLEYLQNCLKSLISAIKKRDLNFFSSVDIHVGYNADSNSHRRLLEYLEPPDYIKSYVWSDAIFPGHARNRVIYNGKIEGWILFLDDDTEIPEDYFQNLKEVFLKLKVPEDYLIGGPNINSPHASKSEFYQYKVLQSPLLAGPFHRRYNQAESHFSRHSYSLILCHMLMYYRKSNGDLFAPFLKSGEENEFFTRLDRTFYYDKNLVIYHRRRNNLAAFYKQAINFGRGRTSIFQIQNGRAITILFKFILGVVFVLFFPLLILTDFFLTVFVLRSGARLFVYALTLHIGYVFGILFTRVNKKNGLK